MATMETKHCLPCEKGIPPLDHKAQQRLLKELAPGWKITDDNKQLVNDFRFNNYYQTIAFVNAIAWMTHFEDHHPDLEVGYNHCLVRYTTHAIDGLSENDFICAAKVSSLVNATE